MGKSCDRIPGSLAAAAAALLAAGCASTDKPREETALARVDTVEITDADFEEALKKLEGTDLPALTLKEWRSRFQLLIDRQLLLLEARRRNLFDDPDVSREVEAWETAHLTDLLVELEMGASLQWGEEELREFFSQSGADRELRIGRLIFADRTQASAALVRAREGMSYAQLHTLYPNPSGQTGAGGGGMRWLNPLTVREPRLFSLFENGVGAAELIETQGSYHLVVAMEERAVPLQERRGLAELAIERQRRFEANLAYLESLMRKYEVVVDSSGFALLLAAGDPAEVNPALPLVRSTLGEWTVGDYLGNPAGELAVSDAATSLDLRIRRTYFLDRLLDREAREKGLQTRLAEKRRAMREQKAIDAMWARDGLSRIPVTRAEIQDHFERNRDRYAGELFDSGGAALVQSRVIRDLKEQRAAPLFETYLEELRARHEQIVAVHEDRFHDFVARKRRESEPVGHSGEGP